MRGSAGRIEEEGEPRDLEPDPRALEEEGRVAEAKARPEGAGSPEPSPF